MDHEQTMGVSSRVLDQKQQKIFGHISLFWSVELQGHAEQLNGGDHDWLIQTPVNTVQRGMLVQPDADTDHLYSSGSVLRSTTAVFFQLYLKPDVHYFFPRISFPGTTLLKK